LGVGIVGDRQGRLEKIGARTEFWEVSGTSCGDDELWGQPRISCPATQGQTLPRRDTLRRDRP
jgi:hypothetical protein